MIYLWHTFRIEFLQNFSCLIRIELAILTSQWSPVRNSFPSSGRSVICYHRRCRWRHVGIAIGATWAIMAADPGALVVHGILWYIRLQFVLDVGPCIEFVGKTVGIDLLNKSASFVGRRVFRFPFSRMIMKNMMLRLHEKSCVPAVLDSSQLATERTEAKCVKETSVTYFTGIGNALAWPNLRPFFEKNNPGAINNVSLHTAEVKHFLNLRNTNNVIVRRSSYLDYVMIFMMNKTAGTQCTAHTIQTIHIAFAFAEISMDFTGHKKASSQKRTQPWRTHFFCNVHRHLNRPGTYHHFFSSGLEQTNFMPILKRQFFQLNGLPAHL